MGVSQNLRASPLEDGSYFNRKTLAILWWSLITLEIWWAFKSNSLKVEPLAGVFKFCLEHDFAP